MRTIKNTLFISLLLFVFTANSQITDTLTSNKKDALNLYVDCKWCDVEHFKTQITIVNYVRDRKNADVHLIITEISTGSGGVEYNMQFIGKGRFKNLSDTLKFALPPNSTNEEIRDAQIEKIKIGLTPFILKTPYVDKLTISYNSDNNNEEKKEIIEDKWKSWVAEISTSGYANGEDTYLNYNTWSSVGITKVTPDIKIELRYHNNYNESIYRFETDTIVSISRSNQGNALITFSVGNHWAVGAFANIYSSTFSNMDISTAILPAIEYNVFKYEDATTKQLRFIYKVGYQYNYYIDTTIFNKTEEGYFNHYLNINYKTVKQWGSIEGSVYASTLLKDFNKNRIGAYIGGSIRIFKGLSFNVYGGYSQKRDQISLPKEESSTEDILLRKKEMASNYNFWVNFGLSYTFGSIYNNVVNVRFDD